MRAARLISGVDQRLHYGLKHLEKSTSNITLSHKRVSAAERATEASNVVGVNNKAVKKMIQYLHPNFRLTQTNVHSGLAHDSLH